MLALPEGVSQHIAIDHGLSEISKRGPKCSLCKSIIKKLEKMIGKDRSEAKIRHALGEVCHHMPHLIRKKCKKYVDKYTNKIVELLIKKLPPNQVYAKEHHSRTLKP